MRRIAKGILKHRWLVLLVFGLALLWSFWASSQVQVNFNLSDYLPDESASTRGLRLMEAEFDSKPANLRIVLEGVSIPEAMEAKRSIASIPGVKDVNFLDDSVDIKMPLDMLPQKAIDAWYKDGNALITAYVIDAAGKDALAAIRGIIGENNAMAGDIVQTMETRERVRTDIRKILMLVILIILAILLISTSSYFEPLLFLSTIGVAIMLGKGTDLMLGSVSFITNACSAILQLAISMDYAIFLLEAFSDNRKLGQDTEEAMINAMVKAFSSIISSSVTTIMGFAVMVLMQFKVGYDMGIVLAKDIAISLLAVLVLLPVLASMTSKIVERTHHRPLLPSFKVFGLVCSKICVPLMIIIAACIVYPSFLGAQRVEFIYGTNEMITDPQARVVQDQNRIDELYDKSNQMVLLFPGGDPARAQRMQNDLEGLPEIAAIISYGSMADTVIPMEFVGRDNLKELVGDRYDRMILSANIEGESERAYSLVETIRAISEQYYPEDNYLTGGTAVTYDMRATVIKDDALVNMLALLSIGLVLLINFKSISIPIILLLTIKSSVFVNVGVPYFTGESMYYIASLIINAIQLGATVDYAILFTERYMEKRHEMPRTHAAAMAISSTMSAILTSSSIMIAGGLTLGKLSSVSVVGELGVLVGRGAAISATLVLTALPALLIVFDPIIRITSIRTGFYKKPKKGVIIL